MHLNIRFFRSEEPAEAQVESFSGMVDLSGITRWGERPFPEPAVVSGNLSHRHGEITLDYRVEYTLCGACARCLEPVRRPEQAEFTHVVTEEDGDDIPEEWLHAPDGQLDMEEVAGSDLLLSLDGAVLCSEDCLGLCPHCGVNRNLHPCDCESRHKKTDPRFEALLEFLE